MWAWLLLFHAKYLADNSKITMESVFCGIVPCFDTLIAPDHSLCFWYCISELWSTSTNYTGLTRNTVYWYLMMQASVHIISYVLHLDLSSSNKSYSSSLIASTSFAHTLPALNRLCLCLSSSYSNTVELRTMCFSCCFSQWNANPDRAIPPR